MAAAAVPMVSHSRFQTKLFTRPFQVRRCKFLGIANHNISRNPATRLVSSQFYIPEDAISKMNIVKEKLWKSIPDPIKDFPWKKAEDLVLHRLLVLGKKASKWCFVMWFVFSFASDIISTISKNRELAMPVGLFVGCLMTNFLKEVSYELLPASEVKELRRQLVGMAYLFVMIKLVSGVFPLWGQMFMSHLANGGLLQILWIWNTSHHEHFVKVT